MDPSRDPFAVPDAIAKEIEAALRDALSNYGIAGRVVLRGKTLELHTGDAPVIIELDLLQEQWPLLPPEMRQRKIGEVARRLVAAHRGAAAGADKDPAAAGRPKLPPKPIMISTGGLLAVGLLALAAYRIFPGLFASGGDPKAASSGAPTETEEQARERRARVCDAARKRLYAGASIGAFDTEGWVVELWLARAKGEGELKDHAAVKELVQGDHIAAAADPLLADLQDGTVQVLDGFAPEEAAKAGTWKSITIRMGGRYVGAFFDPAERARIVALGDRLAERLPAHMGALYARCAHLPHHDLGTWFRGSDGASAAAALVFKQGLHSEVPAVSRVSFATLGGASQLDGLREAGGKLDSMALATLVGPDGGSVTPWPDGAVSIGFPAMGGTRVYRASRVVARKLGVGVEGD